MIDNDPELTTISVNTGQFFILTDDSLHLNNQWDASWPRVGKKAEKNSQRPKGSWTFIPRLTNERTAVRKYAFVLNQLGIKVIHPERGRRRRRMREKERLRESVSAEHTIFHL